MSILDDLNKSIRKKMVSKTAEDIASNIYKQAKDTAKKVVEEVRDEENQEKAKDAVRQMGQEARRLGDQALQTLGFEVEGSQEEDEAEPEPARQGESVRERLKREMGQGADG